MQKRNITTKITLMRSGRKLRGFTLVELVVVLVILAILATAGTFAAVGYIRKAKLDKNNQNAISVYQTAQTALTKKSANGTMGTWIADIPGLDLENSELNNLNDKSTNFSGHETVILTYNKQTSDHDEDKYLNDLLAPYFYDRTVFNATFSVVFDICATWNNGSVTYSANVISVYYSAENGLPDSYDASGDTTKSGGWDAIRTHGRTDGLPDISDAEHRSSKSFVGYYNGQLDSTDPETVLNISSVAIPFDQTVELEGHIIGPTDDNSRASGYLFNLRNGETLDISWAIFDEDRDEEKAAESGYNYYYSAREEHDENLHMILYDDSNENTKIELYVDQAAMEAVAYDTEHVYTTYEQVDNFEIVRQSWNGFIKINVKRNGETSTTKLTFPITKTLVKGDGRTGCPKDTEKGYYEYSLALDAMMSRGSGIDKSSSDYTKSLCIERLFKDRTPRNIHAIMSSDSSWKYLDCNNTEQEKTGLANTYAARAINDPVYYSSTGSDGEHAVNYYAVREHCAVLDGEDDNSSEEYTITGKAVVNTYYGDKAYGSETDDSGKVKYIGGTTWTSSNGEAVLTNCRHLYNIRWQSGIDITYRIVSDINWYVKAGTLYSSEVKVFQSLSAYFNSPVGSDGTLRTVSFPAINSLPAKSTLTSISDSDRRIYKINGIQLRLNSFINKTDKGYALICTNNGNIYNIYVDNLSLIIASVNDGVLCDCTKEDANFYPNDPVSIGNANVALDLNPVGGLVGYNLGIIGSASITNDSINTVQVTNSILMSGAYWKTSNLKDVGGVIGKNEGTSSGSASTYGLIRTGGKFLIVGKQNIGGVIGYNISDIGARLVVDGSLNSDNSYFSFPKLAATGQSFSCAIISDNRVGGAIGQFDGNRKFTHDVNRYEISGYNSVTGEPTFTKLDDEDYHIHVTLPKESFVLQLNGNDVPCAGGAIGYLNSSSGEYLAVHTDISGYVISSGSQSTYCGGAIGREIKCSIKTIYLDCDNQSGSFIGSTSSTSGAVCSGGAYGRIETDTTSLDRLIVLNVFNNGTINSRGSGNGQGSGGAIGGVSNTFFIPLKIRVHNDTGSVINGYGSDVSKSNGTGGAIGGMDDSSVLHTDSYIYAENHGEINGVYHVGGAIGNAPQNKGKVYAANYKNISGTDFVGGAIGRSAKEQYGWIQSILSGADIEGRHFVGGATGRILSFQPGATIRTHVRGASTVHGTGYLVGGVCGDVLASSDNTTGKIELKGDSTNPVLSVKGGDGIDGSVGTGGVVGILRTPSAQTVSVISPDQKDLNRLAIHVDGRNDVGGAIGRLINNSSSSNTPSDFVGSGSTTGFDIVLTVILNPQSHIIGTGDNVGGAIGSVFSTGGKFTGEISVSSVYGNSSEQSVISGNQNIGGAVGKLTKSVLYNTDSTYDDTDDKGKNHIYVDFTRSAWTLTSTIASGSNANIGGAFGYITSANDTDTYQKYYKITVKLGESELIADGNNVGGAAGYNDNSLKHTKLSVTLDEFGSIAGGSKVGGVIGNNILVNTAGPIDVIISTINGKVLGDSDYVGGAVGYNFASVKKVDATVNGSVTGKGNMVGGAIGYCHSNNSSYLLTEIIARIQGSGSVNGNDDVGGAVGKNICNIDTINSEITGKASVNGRNRVGGALGFASAAQDVLGGTVLDGGSYGRIIKITSKISADLALSGKTRMGGAVGQVGDKTSQHYNSASLIYVEAILNSAYLFDPSKTGTDSTSADSNACIGGVVGIFVDGRLGVSSSKVSKVTGKVVLNGSGGVVRTSDYIDTRYYPSRTYSNTVFIGASGSSIGGIVGQIGLPNQQQNVCLSNISADKNLKLCVVSLDGKDRIGGWIGSGYAAHGGIGNESLGDYNTASKRVTYNVNNVRAVISVDKYGNGGSEIGGFCGRLDSYNNNKFDNDKFGTYAIINVDLTDANIIGASKVGGVIGEASHARFRRGEINVTLRSYTNIGDVSGNALPGDSNTYSPVCYEAGGVIGSVEKSSHYDVNNNDVNNNSNTKYFTFEIPVNVVIDSTSRICAMEAPASGASTYGVGGIFGRIESRLDFNNPPSTLSFSVISEDGSSVAIRSAYTNVGGIAGVVIGGGLMKATVNATVQSDADGMCAGGVVGKVIAGKVENCHFGPDSVVEGEGYFSDDTRFGEGASYDPAEYRVISTGSSYVGGFAGSIVNSDSIMNCYTTATVSAPNAGAAGGFVGNADKGTVTNCYVGGHTYSKHYISNDGNVSGSDNVGGFAGQITSSISISNCYSTASVYGSGSSLGGFAGSTEGNASISDCYCSGLVVSKNNGTVGSFVGNTSNTTYSNSCSMAGVNINKPLAGNETGVSGLSEKTAVEIKGTNNNDAHPFDSELLGSKYGLRAVINSEHWGDWPDAVDNRKNIAGLTIKLNKTEYEYRKSGYDIENDLVFTDGDGAVVDLEFGTDYTLNYSNASGVTDKATVIITGINEYYGAVSKTFTITQASITGADVIINYPKDNMSFFEYTGAPQLPKSEVRLNGELLTDNVDYYLVYLPDNINIGFFTVSVVGTGNYKEQIDDVETLEIKGRNLGDAEVTLLDASAKYVYDGTAKEPLVTVRIDGRTLEYKKDYDLEYENNIDAGTATIKVVPYENPNDPGKAQYSGSKEITFTIEQATNVISVEPEIQGWTWNSTPNDLTYELRATFGTPLYSVHTDESCSEESRVVGPCEVASLKEAMKVLDAGDYYLLAEIAETTNYTDVFKKVPFTITRWDFTDAVKVKLDYDPEHPDDSLKIPYDGSPHKPSVTVLYNENEILDPSNYNTVTYDSDTTSVGTKTVHITGSKNCTGTASAEYEILNVWTVTFDPAPGTVDDPATLTQPVTDHEKAHEISDPEYDGYRFDGWYWYSNPSVFEEYNFDSEVTSDLNLYAHWTKLWTVTLVYNNGDADYVDEVGNGEKMPAPADPTREGYKFDGWYVDSGFTNKWESFDVPIEKDYTLYAKWDGIKYTVDFESNQGSAVPSQELTYPDTVTEPAEPSREGYDFDGWYKDVDCTELFDGFDQAYTSSFTLYAKWTKVWQVTLVLNNGSENRVISARDKEPLPDQANLTRTDYTFAGWYTDSGCTEEWAGGNIEGDLTLYAGWTPVPYTVTFNTNGGSEVDAQTVSCEDKLVKPEDPERDGYRFDGWYKDEGFTQAFDGFDLTYTEDFTLYAKWTEAWKVTLVLYDGKQEVVYVEKTKNFDKPADPTRENYAFDGWYKDSGFTTAWNGFGSPLDGNLVLYAKWRDA